MATYELGPERPNLHGHFSRDLRPVLTISPGDTVRFATPAAGWRWQTRMASDTPPEFERDPELDRGHALCGPIAVRGAEPGMALEVRIGRLRPGPWGTTVASIRDERYARLGITHETALHWVIDAEAGTARDQHGHTVRLRPFMGVMGNAPAAPGRHPTPPPRACGGNMDCRELVAGSTLWLPIEVPGALFSVGDGHGAQGDGEVSGTAIECPMEVCELTFDLRPDLRLTTPRADTPAGLLTLGFAADLDEAALIALDAMLDVLGERTRLPRAEALALASVVADLRVTQIVNAGVYGVHAVLPPDALITPSHPHHAP